MLSNPFSRTMRNVIIIFAVLLGAAFALHVVMRLEGIPLDGTPGGGCGECPQLSPPAPGWCEGGVIIPGEEDACGCPQPPVCRMPHYCTEEDRQAEACTAEYLPVCGWYGPNFDCAYPCAVEFGNGCEACRNPNIGYWTEGNCPPAE